MVKTPEGKIKAAILKYLKLRGIYAWNNPTGAFQVRPGEWMRFGKKGSSDILGLLPGGRFLAVECKAEYGRLSSEQREFLNDIAALGGLAVVARSFRDIDTALREAGYSGITDGPLFDALLAGEGND
ncbi:MAG: VRR-NUC domain-containing protein [Treponema sp.]|nr:VRR-NUC domain-containing protein [Treponema sp.]